MSIHCRLLEGERNGDWCAFQYLCNQTRKWEVSQQGRTCRVKEKPLPALRATFPKGEG